EFAGQTGIQSRLVELFCVVAEELITNALYDAPVDAARRHRFAHLPRTEAVALGKDEGISVSLCCDGRRLGIAVADPFGSLTPSKVLEYLSKCFQRGERQVDRKEGGAGLGLYYTLESLSHFIINIQPGRRTETIGLLDIRVSYKDFVTQNK